MKYLLLATPLLTSCVLTNAYFISPNPTSEPSDMTYWDMTFPAPTHVVHFCDYDFDPLCGEAHGTDKFTNLPFETTCPKCRIRKEKQDKLSEEYRAQRVRQLIRDDEEIQL